MHQVETALLEEIMTLRTAKPILSHLEVGQFYHHLIFLLDNKYPYTTMNLMITGQIESGQIPDDNGICCKFDFTHGKDWHLYSGN